MDGRVIAGLYEGRPVYSVPGADSCYILTQTGEPVFLSGDQMAALSDISAAGDGGQRTLLVNWADGSASVLRLNAPAQPQPVLQEDVYTWEEPQPRSPRQVPARKPFWKSGGFLAAVALVVVISLVVAMVLGGRCDYGSCNRETVSGSDYCAEHKCTVSGCKNSAYSYGYCYTHYSLLLGSASSSYVSSYDLKISGIRVYSSGSYTRAEGSITNNSDSTVTFLKVKGSFVDSRGNVIDTDWTYAVGSEGLAPGETTKWSMSVPKDSKITDCKVTILDYDY